MSQQHLTNDGRAAVWAPADWPGQSYGGSLWQCTVLPLLSHQQNPHCHFWYARCLKILTYYTFKGHVKTWHNQTDNWFSSHCAFKPISAGTTSSSNTVIAIQENISDNEDPKMAQESEDRYSNNAYLIIKHVPVLKISPAVTGTE